MVKSGDTGSKMVKSTCRSVLVSGFVSTAGSEVGKSCEFVQL